MPGRITRFDGFLLDVPDGIDVTAFNTGLVWCGAFGAFIIAAQYR